MRHLYYQKFDKNRISPLQRKVLTLKVFTFASEFLKIRIMEIKEYFEKEMFFENLPSIVFTPPSVPPVLGDRNPQGREDVTALQYCICPTCPSPAGGALTHSQALALSKRARDVTALRCSEPLRFMVVGPSKVCAMLCGMGPPGERWIGLLKCWFCGNLLITCRFLVIFLVVSRKKRNFAVRY